MNAMPVRRPVKPASSDQLAQRRHRPDYMLPVLSLLLLICGLVVIYTISPGLAVQKGVAENYYAYRQLTAIGLGLLAFAAAAWLPMRLWPKLAWPLIISAIIATLIALVTPVSPDYPAPRWVRLGGLSFQSVELVKLAVVFVLASFLAQRAKQGLTADLKKTFKPMVIVLALITVVVAFFQSDLGSTFVIVMMMAAMAYVVGFPLKRVLVIGVIIAVGMGIFIITSDYRRDRVLTFLNPQRDCQNAGYQACQALIAVGSGGLVGKGIGQSVQAYGYLPEAANDSIFAIYAEKFGFVGVSVLIALMFAFLTRIVRVLERTPDTTTRLMVAGILAWLSTQIIMNIGAMVGLLPLKGITLPLISYGGTSIIFIMAAVGLVFNISRFTSLRPQAITEGNTNDYSTSRRGVGRPHYAYPSRRS